MKVSAKDVNTTPSRRIAPAACGVGIPATRGSSNPKGPTPSVQTRGAVAAKDPDNSQSPTVIMRDDVTRSIQPMPTNLDRQEDLDEEIQPGAYACSGMLIFRPISVQWSILGRPAPSSSREGSEVEEDCGSVTNITDHTTETESIGTNNTALPTFLDEEQSELATAKPVSEDERDIPRAEHYDQNRRSNGGERKLQVGAICLLISAGVVGMTLLVLAILGCKHHHQGVISLPSSSSPSPATIKPYPLSLFPASTITATETDETSPQFQAYEWMLDDPSLETYPTHRVQQRFALATLFFSTAGPTSWINNNNWLSYDHHECDWYTHKRFGHSANTTDGTLHTYAMGPEGKCSLEGEYLHFWLYVNGLQGPIPEEFYWLTNLKSIDFSMNQKLTGSISSHIGELSQLEKLMIASNSLSGNIPTEIGKAIKLEGLFTYNNHKTLGSTIPSELGLLPDFAYFVGSGIHGTLPTQLGLLSKLVWLEIWSCWETPHVLTGTLPTQLGLLSSLVELNLDENALSGTLPSQIGMLEELAMISVEENELLTGTLPTQLGQLQQLQKLWLYKTNLEGSIPSQLGAMKSLKELKLSANSLLTGSIPPSLEESTSLTMLNVSDTAIIGTIPSQLCHLTSSNNLLFDCNPSLLCGCNCSCSSNSSGNHHHDQDNIP